MRVDLFDYELPDDRIAQRPRPRGSSRLLVLDRSTGNVFHQRFADFPDFLDPSDLLVRNDVRVRHARLYGRDAENRLVELFLLEPLEGDARRWSTLARPGRRAKAGRIIAFPTGLEATVARVHPDGKRELLFDRPVEAPLLEEIGHVPLPPYIRREPGAPDAAEDRAAYQTIFAREPKAVAAPTAGLHFSPEILSRVAARGIRVADLTLAIGAATFAPVRVEDTAQHVIGAEDVTIPRVTRQAVEDAHRGGQRLVAVGTTVTRALEASARMEPSDASRGDLRFRTDLFITPGFEFRRVNALLTNFHLPRSSLLMLACAFGGREHVLGAYAEAVRKGYLFYSFGDAMLIR
ncbi:MAG: tRNA preQ1(34) S-adenosylmethionine ribosyltransferase-isomerase QueA [Thermoanaerobaculia bacterium]|nr:tRNA preQ1(34) S-adenosylmethionine ribosyltransferase-isomerase QueA [Thermoanaerobaculia bacterium]